MTSCGWWPLPRAMRRMREGASILVSSSSASFMESIIVIHFLMRTPATVGDAGCNHMHVHVHVHVHAREAATLCNGGEAAARGGGGP